MPFSAVLMVFLPYGDHTANFCGLDDGERGAQYRKPRPPWLHSASRIEDPEATGRSAYLSRPIGCPSFVRERS